MNTRKYCLACDLKDDETLILEYKAHHNAENFWPEITTSIREAGIQHMEIYLIGNRMFMIIEVDENFDFSKKTKMDADNETVQEWEVLMDNYQQRLPFAKAGEKWVLMNKIFEI